MLQEIVIKLELDSTSSTGVRLCLGEISSEELHRVCREAAQVHTSVCTAVGPCPWHSGSAGSGTGPGTALPPGPGWAGQPPPAALHCRGHRQSSRGSSCCRVWASQGSAQGFLREAAHRPGPALCSLPRAHPCYFRACEQSLVNLFYIQFCQIPVSAAFPE